MKRSLALFLGACLFFISCKKDNSLPPTAAFSFRGDNSAVLRVATYDTCSLFSSSRSTDSNRWDLGNGTTLSGQQAVISYTKSGSYTVTLTVTAGDGRQATISKKVVVLDRVLKKITVKKIYWDPIPNQIPYFNSVWPQTDSADVYVQFLHFRMGDSVAPYSGLMPNSPILYTSNIVSGIPHQDNQSFDIPLPSPFIIDKKMVLDRSLAFFLMAKDKNGTAYNIQCSHESGAFWGFMTEDFDHNSFTMTSSMMSLVEFSGGYE